MPVNWIPAPVALSVFSPSLTSPLSVPNGFGEDKVSPIQIHDSVLQVEFPFVLTSVNLGSREKEINAVGVKTDGDCIHHEVDTVSNAFTLGQTRAL